MARAISALSSASLLVLLACSGAACGTTIPAPTTPGAFATAWAPVHLLPRDRYGDAGHVVVLDETIAAFRRSEDGGAPQLELIRHVVRQVLAARDERAGTILVPHDPQHELLEFRGRVVEPDGRAHELRRDDAIDQPLNPAWQLYGDSRLLRMQLEWTARGTIIEYVARHRVTELPRAHVAMAFGAPIPIEQARLEVTVTDGDELEWVAQQLGTAIEFAPRIERIKGGQRYTWERRQVSALVGEPDAPEATELVPRITARLRRWHDGDAVVQSFRDAQAVADWMRSLLLGDGDLTGRGRAVVAPGDTTPAAIAARLYGWVRDHISYCAIEIGIGGYRPHRAADVLRHQYGDCKDKANLLRALLADAGIASHLVLIRAHDGFPVRSLLPGPHNYNHAILSIDLGEGSVLADPTSPVTPFGELPPGDQGAEFVPVVAAGAEARVAPLMRPDDNLLASTFDLALEGATLRGTFRVEARGAVAGALRALLAHGTAVDHAARLATALEIPHARLTGLEITALAPPLTPTPLVVSGQVSIVIGDGARLRYLRLSDLLAPPWRPHTGAVRRWPLLLGPPRRASLTAHIRLPAGTTLALPPPTDGAQPFAAYHLGFARDGDTLVVTRDATVLAPLVSVADFPAYQALAGGAERAEARALFLHSAGDR